MKRLPMRENDICAPRYRALTSLPHYFRTICADFEMLPGKEEETFGGIHH